ncbi:hypothetical protein PENTCL1PPCAC_28308, partial [Pristionchus entomophagus]
SFDGGKGSRATISRGAISNLRESPLILTMITSQLSVKEKDLYRVGAIKSCGDSRQIDCGLSLVQFRSALKRLSLSSVEVEKVLCAIILIRTLRIDRGLIDTTHHLENAKNLANASFLLGVSLNLLKTVIESSHPSEQALSGAVLASSALLEALIDFLIDHANSLLDDVITRGKSSPTESNSSTTDSGIDMPKCTVTTIEVESRPQDSASEAILRRLRRYMQSLFSQQNCQSRFVLRLFSASSPPLRSQSRQPSPENQHSHSIICFRTNDDCEYLRPDFYAIKIQLQMFRKRIEEAPALP